MRADNKLRLLLSADQARFYPEALTLHLTHPTIDGRDQHIEMKSEGAGFYNGVLAADVAGRWHVSLEDPAGQWRLQGDWRADLDEPLRLRARAE